MSAKVSALRGSEKKSEEKKCSPKISSRPRCSVLRVTPKGEARKNDT